MELVTRRYFSKRTVLLLQKSVKVSDWNPFEFKEHEIPFDNIQNTYTLNSKINFGFMAVAILSGILWFLNSIGSNAELAPLWFALMVFFAVVSFLARNRTMTIICPGYESIVLHYTKRKLPENIAFVNAMIEAINQYLVDKYSKVDKDLPIEVQLHNLMFLQEKELISEEKFQELKNYLLGKNSKNQIGYYSGV